MKDHRWHPRDGSPPMTIAEMPTAEIYNCLSAGINIIYHDGGSSTAEDVRERLRIELLIRERNLRGEFT